MIYEKAVIILCKFTL